MKQFLLSCLLLLLVVGCSRNEVIPSPAPLSAAKTSPNAATAPTKHTSGATASKVIPIDDPMICHTLAHDDGTLYWECRPAGGGGGGTYYDPPIEYNFRTTTEFGYINHRISTVGDEIVQVTTTHRTNPGGYVQNAWADNSLNTPGFFSYTLQFSINGVAHQALISWDKSAPVGTVQKDF